MSVSINGTNGLTFGDGSAQNTGGYTGFRNRIINGDMRIDQRNAGASVTPTVASYTYPCDRFGVYVSQASKLTAQQNAGAVTPPTGFTNYIGIVSSSSYSVASSDIFILAQKIEGFNCADFGWGTVNAQTVTLSFQVRSSLTGTFGGSLSSYAGAQSYPFTYSIPVANRWTAITLTIPGATSGTWGSGNNGCIQVNFGLGVGSSNSGTSGSWLSSTLFSATGATSIVGTSGATFYITGVQLEKGSVATPFEFRPYGTELALCQRYYWASPVSATQVIDMLSPINSAPVTQPIACLPTMRTVPTCSAPSVYASSGITLNSPAVATSATASAMLISGSWSASGGNRGYVIFNSGNLTASAEI